MFLRGGECVYGRSRSAHPGIPYIRRNAPFIRSQPLSPPMLSSMNPSDQPTGVGLSDPLYASRRRRMLDVVNALHLTGYVAWSLSSYLIF